MLRPMKLLAAVAVVSGLGLATQTASAQVKAQPQIVTGAGASWYLPPQHWHPRPPLPNPGPFPPPRHDHDYRVYVLKPFVGWTYQGRYETLSQARQVEWRLERLGYRVKVETIHDHRGPRRW